MNYKEETKKRYNINSWEFDDKFNDHFVNHVKKEADIFLHNLKDNKIIDLGCGPGNHAEYFTRKKCNVLCLDYAEGMIDLCRKKGLNAELMDIEELNLPEKSFDGIWAYASLLHVLRYKLPCIIEKLRQVLKPNGIIGLALKEGKGEEYKSSDDYPGTKRYFVYFTEDEIKQLFSKYFELIHMSKTELKDYSFMNFVFKLKQ